MLKVGVPGFTQVPQLLVYNLFFISYCFRMLLYPDPNVDPNRSG